eukprot:403368794
MKFIASTGLIARILFSLSVVSFSISNVLGQETFYKRGLTDHFVDWLNANKNYYPYHFNRTEFFGGSFGGKENDTTPIARRPVIFVHGGADRLIGSNETFNGFRYSIEYFLQHGYTKAEIYGSMWGYADEATENQMVFSTEWILQIRTFIKAVLEYTGAEQVDVISHSAGVVFSRAVLKGGFWDLDVGQPVYVGEPLSHKVRTFIGIAGSNFGRMLCVDEEQLRLIRFCNKDNGMFPGSKDTPGLQPKDISNILARLNKDNTREAEHTYAMYGLHDQTKPGNFVYSRRTSEYPTMDRAVVFNATEYDHDGSRDLTCDVQYAIVNLENHQELHNNTRYIVRKGDDNITVLE